MDTPSVSPSFPIFSDHQQPQPWRGILSRSRPPAEAAMHACPLRRDTGSERRRDRSPADRCIPPSRISHVSISAFLRGRDAPPWAKKNSPYLIGCDAVAGTGPFSAGDASGLLSFPLVACWTEYSVYRADLPYPWACHEEARAIAEHGGSAWPLAASTLRRAPASQPAARKDGPL